METTLEKIKGCMFGGAIGDALGYPVEFKRVKEIQYVDVLVLYLL